MNNRSFSEEEMRQREKEERSRLRKQEQAYREAQRGSIPASIRNRMPCPRITGQLFGRTPGPAV